MTWQGGKRGREVGPVPVFARLKALSGARDAPDKALRLLAAALRDFAKPASIHVRLIDGDSVEHWEVQAGSENARAAETAEESRRDCDHAAADVAFDSPGTTCALRSLICRKAEGGRRF